ncbi:MAG: metallophosphoesterase [Lachnospiraceae bacterium]|nr:metallophosphoesterase [Lachnospiraceae bacterium]
MKKERLENKTHTKTGRKGARRVAWGLLLLLAVTWAISWIPVTERITIRLPQVSSDGVGIVLITDLHSCYYGREQKWLIRRIEKEQPDLILLGGDIFDDVFTDQNAKITLQRLAAKYPCYYVTGNHEYWSDRAQQMKEIVKECGATVLAGSCQSITVSGTTLDICGVDDPDGCTGMQWNEQLDSAFLGTKEDHVKILLSHRPERTLDYEQYPFDLILTGHAHGGQFGLPVIRRGVFSPDQGFMAKYVSGLYTLKNGAIMEVSRGLSRERTPLPRFFNHPEVVSIKLSSKAE